MLPKSPSNDDKLVLILAEAFYKKHWIYACFEGEDFFFSCILWTFKCSQTSQGMFPTV